MNYAVIVLIAGTNGIWTRSSSRSVARGTLWRAVDQQGNVLDIRVAEPTHQASCKEIRYAALLKGLEYVPGVIITDKLASYGEAKREILGSVEHRQHKRREYSSGKLTSPPLHDCERRKCGGSSQQVMQSVLLSAFSPISEHFKPPRHRMKAQEYRALLQSRFQVWSEVTG